MLVSRCFKSYRQYNNIDLVSIRYAERYLHLYGKFLSNFEIGLEQLHKILHICSLVSTPFVVTIKYFNIRRNCHWILPTYQGVLGLSPISAMDFLMLNYSTLCMAEFFCVPMPFDNAPPVLSSEEASPLCWLQAKGDPPIVSVFLYVTQSNQGIDLQVPSYSRDKPKEKENVLQYKAIFQLGICGSVLVAVVSVFCVLSSSQIMMTPASQILK